jgi:NitT/TauT family transport system permease protein
MASELLALRAPLPRRLRPFFALAAWVLLLGGWCALSYGGVVSSAFLPKPHEVLRGLFQLFYEKELGTAIWTSTLRIGKAFLLASALALPLGLAMGALEPVNRFFEPVMAPLRFMPISAFIPLLIVWFGIDDGQKIAFLFLGVFVYLLPVVVNAVRTVPQEYVDTAYTLGASKAQAVFTVLLPAALPEIVEAFRVMNAIAWTYVILAEAVNPGQSLGYIIQLAYTHARPDWSFAGLVVVGGIGLLTDALLRLVIQLLFRWREETRG